MRLPLATAESAAVDTHRYVQCVPVVSRSSPYPPCYGYYAIAVTRRVGLARKTRYQRLVDTVTHSTSWYGIRYARTYTTTHSDWHTHAHADMYVRMYICVYSAHVQISLYICMLVRTYTHTHLCIHPPPTTKHIHTIPDWV